VNGGERSEWRAALLLAASVIAIGVIVYCADPTFFWHDDVQAQHLPASREIARAWSEGTFPLLTSSSWYAGALAGEFLYGVFSLFMTVCNVAVWSVSPGLAVAAAALAIAHLVVTALGSFFLARDFRLSRPLAAFVAFIGAFNGWLLIWGAKSWYPALTSFAWLPWVWLGIRCASAGRLTWMGAAGLAVAWYLLIAAGWPFTIVMAALLFVWHVAPIVRQRRWPALADVIGTAAAGAGLAAPALLMLVEYSASSGRVQAGLSWWRTWIVPPRALLSLFVPTFTTTWDGFGGPAPHAGLDLAGGGLPLIFLIAALLLLRMPFLRANAGIIALVAVTLLLSMLPSVGAIRCSFRWLPLVHLALAIAGALGLQALQAGAPRVNVGVLASLAFAAAGAMILLLDRDKSVVSVALITLLVLLGWSLVEAWRKALAPWCAVVAALATLFVPLPFRQTDPFPDWVLDNSLDRAQPFDPSRLYLSLYRFDDLLQPSRLRGPLAAASQPLFRPSNTPMHAGLHFINGYSSMESGGLGFLLGFSTHGQVENRLAVTLLKFESGPGALLDHLAVDGLLVDQALLDDAHVRELPGWTIAARNGRDVVLHRVDRVGNPVCLIPASVRAASDLDALVGIRSRRTLTMPFILTTGVHDAVVRRHCTDALLRNARVSRLSTSVDLDATRCQSETAVIFSRPWFPGFKATIDGKPLPVFKADMAMPAVIVGAGSKGRLVLRYWPSSLTEGIVISSLTLLAGILVLRRRRRQELAR
jgi:hypothetical protein